MYGVDFVDNSSGWCVGQSKSVYRTTDGGSTWTESTTPSTTDLDGGICFIDSLRGWAAGGNTYFDKTAAGTIVTSADGGKTWTVQENNSDYRFNSICFVDSHSGWTVGETYDEAVGSNGRTAVFRTSDGGQTWTEIEVSAISGGLKDVFFVDATYGWAVGQDGSIVHSQDGGMTWESQTSGTSAWLYSVHFVDRNRGWIAGHGGASTVVLRTTDGGTNWIATDVGAADAGLREIFFVDEFLGWASGPAGGLVRSTDGGLRWTNDGPDTDVWLNAACFLDAETGWLVGGDGTVFRYSAAQ
jgi:photosystem II stability/assembly factor-like uncharacterized protein